MEEASKIALNSASLRLWKIEAVYVNREHEYIIKLKEKHKDFYEVEKYTEPQ